MKENYTILNVEDIDFDKDNPRIKKALEKYGENINEERIRFSLRSASENGGKGRSTYNGLCDAIRATEGVMTPITVIKRDNRHVCIDGNTRLSIYKKFISENVPGDWSKIKATVLENATQQNIEEVRISAHLVGSRNWPAYEKARYLHQLRNQDLMKYDRMISTCGGNKSEIERQIDAYHDMNDYYRDVVSDDEFKMERFSGFVELQKPSVKKAIYEAGLGLEDFGEWIRTGKIYRMADVRRLPGVLGDKEAKDVFLKGGVNSIGDAIKLLEQRLEKQGGVTLENATVYELAEILTQRIDKLAWTEVRALGDKESNESAERIGVLENLAEHLQALLENVSE